VVSRVIEAIYEGGALRLLEPLELEEKQRVRVTVEPLPQKSTTNGAEKLERYHRLLEESREYIVTPEEEDFTAVIRAMRDKREIR